MTCRIMSDVGKAKPKNPSAMRAVFSITASRSSPKEGRTFSMIQKLTSPAIGKEMVLCCVWWSLSKSLYSSGLLEAMDKVTTNAASASSRPSANHGCAFS